LDELQAAILRVLLPHLDEWSAGRRRAASLYEQAGLGKLVKLPAVAPEAEPAWHLYVVRHEQADGLLAELAGAGIEARAYYRTPVHRQPAMSPWAPSRELPATEKLAATNLAIPMSPVLTAEQAEEVVSAVRAAVAQPQRA
jgi:dTDP-4-amino-4,6-dideoxygalactose transaminase